MTASDLLGSAWVARTTRLRLGVEPLDALGAPGPVTGLALHLEGVPLPAAVPAGAPGVMPFGDMADSAGLPGVARNPSGRFALAFGQSVVDAATDRVVVRILDPDRRYVPRRLSIPIPTFQAVVDAEVAHDGDPLSPLTPRSFRPVLFPGAAYGEAAGATILRGRVTWNADGSPAQWARVVARTAAPVDIRDDQGDIVGTSQPVLGRAQGDDRGEFVLVVGTVPKELALAKSRTVALEVVVSARPEPAPGPPVESPLRSRVDPLWHLPIEMVGSLNPSDAVASGVTTPGGFTSSVTAAVTCRRGRVTRPSVSFVLP